MFVVRLNTAHMVEGGNDRVIANVRAVSVVNDLASGWIQKDLKPDRHAVVEALIAFSTGDEQIGIGNKMLRPPRNHI